MTGTARIALVAHAAIAAPSATPKPASSRFSTSSRRAMRGRLAPSASRTPISRWRKIGRASCRESGWGAAEDGIRDTSVTGVQTCALPIFSLKADRERADDRDGAHRVGRPRRDRRAERDAEAGEQQVFNQQQTRNAGTAGAEREPYAHLALAQDRKSVV